MTIADLKKELKAPSGVYLFYGEEEYLKHHYLRLMREAVLTDESLAAFNHTVLSGESELGRLASACDMIPVMADKKLIEIHSVKYTAPKKKESEEEQGKSQTDALIEALSGVEADTVVVLYTSPAEFDAGTGKATSAIYKKLEKVAKPVEFAHQTPAKLSVWLAKHFVRANITASQQDLLFMIDYCSTDMSALANETDKLIAYLLQNGKSVLSRGDITKICSHTDEIAAFDFSNALLAGNTARSYAILSDMLSKKQKPEMILGSIASAYCSLLRIRVFSDAGMSVQEIAKALSWKEGRVSLYLRSARNYSAKALEAAVRACHDADVKMKTSQGDKAGILTALVGGGI